MSLPRKRPGPKPKPAEELRSMTRSCRLRPDEAALLKRAAGIQGQRTTKWMRETLVRVARRILRKAGR